MKRAYQLADHKIEIKESEREKYLNLARVQKKKQNKKKNTPAKHERNCDTNCLGTFPHKIVGTGDQSNNRDHPDRSTNRLEYLEVLETLRKLVVTLTPKKENYQLKVV